MPDRPDIPRPSPKTPYRVRAKNSQVEGDWHKLLRTHRDAAIRCWDHISATPLSAIGTRYTPLKGSLKTCEFDGQQLPQWQWELDARARVKVAIGKHFVVIMDVSTGHPKENE